MKNKIFSIFLIICLISILIPCTIMAYENKDTVEYGDGKYQLFDDGTAKAISIIERDYLDNYYIDSFVLYNEETYNVTSIADNVFSSFTQKHNLYITSEQAPILENGISFDMINTIYIKQGAKGYSAEAGWPMEKLKTYEIKTQPQDITVEAGDIKNTDILSTSAEYPVGGGSLLYRWYECDKDGNITNNNVLGYYVDFQIPKDITYDNENNTAKDYYYICLVGMDGDVIEPTRVVKVTVNPGTYKVSFASGQLAKWNSTNTDFINVAVNAERKLTTDVIPSSELLKTYGKGLTFIGWTIDEKNIIDPLAITFEKNTTLYPVWHIKVNFDANGGNYSDGSSTFVTNLLSTDYIFDKKILEPTRQGYEFLGFFTEESGGHPYEYLIYDNGINEEVTFYAQWKAVTTNENDGPNNDNSSNDNLNIDNSSSVSNNDSDDSSQNPNTNISNSEDRSNPHTGDNILFVVGLLLISVVGIFATTKFRRNAK